MLSDALAEQLREESRPRTNEELLRICYGHATFSPDQSSQIAAILVSEVGSPIWCTLSVNEFPTGVGYSDERWERPGKYSWIEHGERNAIYAAARAGIQTEGLTMVAAWAACADCARAIIQSGISKLVTHIPEGADHDRWVASIAVAMTMLSEAGVEVVNVTGQLGDCPLVLRDGKLFQP